MCVRRMLKKRSKDYFESLFEKDNVLVQIQTAMDRNQNQLKV